MIYLLGKFGYIHNAFQRLLLLVFCLLLSLPSISQNKPVSSDPHPNSNQSADTTISKILSFPDRLFRKIDGRINNYDKQVTRRTDKALRRIIKQEERMKQMMAGTDSAAARKLFGSGIDSLKRFRETINSKTTKLSSSSSLPGEYFPYLDTLKTSLSFMKDPGSLSVSSPRTPEEVTAALEKVKEVEAKLNYTEKVKGYLRDRQLALKQQLEHMAGYDKLKVEMDKISKEMYYYKQQLASYKEILSDPARVEAEATKLLQKLPAFNRYMAENGALAALFTPKASDNLKGLQTRDMVNQLMKDQMGLSGTDGDKVIDEYLKEGQQQMDKFKQQAAGEGDVEIPGFKPNGQKTKSLWQRIEIGTDCQFNKTTTLLPTTGDFGLSIAYRVMKKGTIGIGGSWKTGFGKDIQHVRVTHEGMTMRSFVEYAVTKGYSIRGGWEKTFLLTQLTTENLTLLRKPENWQQSALIGISKKMSIPLKLPVLKKKSASGSVQLLYDFLHDSHTPATPALQVRVGMGL